MLPSDILGVNWLQDTRQAATIEFWFRLVDRHVASHGVFQGDETDYTFLETAEARKAGYWSPDDAFQLNSTCRRRRLIPLACMHIDLGLMWIGGGWGCVR